MDQWRATASTTTATRSGSRRADLAAPGDGEGQTSRGAHEEWPPAPLRLTAIGPGRTEASSSSSRGDVSTCRAPARHGIRRAADEHARHALFKKTRFDEGPK